MKDKSIAQADEVVMATVKSVSDRLGEDGRILVRESGTEPVIRVMVEAKDEETCRLYVNEVLSVMKEQGHVV